MRKEAERAFSLDWNRFQKIALKGVDFDKHRQGPSVFSHHGCDSEGRNCYQELLSTRHIVCGGGSRIPLQSHPWIPSKVVIRGFVFDPATGELKEVTPKDDR
jgi:hypothetical protein